MEKGRSDQFLSLSDPCPWVWELHTKDDLIAVSVKFLKYLLSTIMPSCHLCSYEMHGLFFMFDIKEFC